MGALRRAGRRTAPFKVGPDFIDPGYHALAALRPGRNLDSVLVGERLIGPLYRHGSAGADIAVIEGVMGLFDGRISDDSGGTAQGSTAHIAAMLGAPVILVVDARGQSQSIAALLHGFSTFDHPPQAAGAPTVRIAGVILNRVGSPRHEQVLRQACEHVGVPVFGAIPRAHELSVPSRHLGLVTAVAASRVTDEPWDPAIAAPTASNVTVALAAGKAFSFGYTEHGELLRAAGADVVEFDPLADPLPPRTAALVLPGGFPEQFSTDLSTNDAVRQQIRDLAVGGAPIHAECAGLTYLVDDLEGYPMCGVLSGS